MLCPIELVQLVSYGEQSLDMCLPFSNIFLSLFKGGNEKGIQKSGNLKLLQLEVQVLYCWSTPLTVFIEFSSLQKDLLNKYENHVLPQPGFVTTLGESLLSELLPQFCLSSLPSRV